MHAALFGLAFILCALYVVVALRGLARHALSVFAFLLPVALVPVVAVSVGGSVHATVVRMAGIIGADVVVFAYKGLARDAFAFKTLLYTVTRIPVAAISVVVGRVGATAALRVADVVGAWVIVVTIRGFASDALSVHALLHTVACVPVVTVSLGRLVNAAVRRVTRVGRARVVVFAYQRLARLAVSVHARFRTVAKISVVALHRLARDTLSLHTGLLPVAHIAVRARIVVVGRVHASRLRLACIVGAQVVVVAFLGFTALARAFAAGIFQRARISIVAGFAVWNVLAHVFVAAGIVRAQVGVIAPAAVAFVFGTGHAALQLLAMEVAVHHARRGFLLDLALESLLACAAGAAATVVSADLALTIGLAQFDAFALFAERLFLGALSAGAAATVLSAFLIFAHRFAHALPTLAFPAFGAGHRHVAPDKCLLAWGGHRQAFAQGPLVKAVGFSRIALGVGANHHA